MSNRQSNVPALLAVLGVVLALAGAWYWYSNYSACGRKRIDTAMGQLQGLTRRWDDAEKLASTTSRIALSTPVSELQSIKRDTEAAVVPPCLAKSKSELVASMDGVIDAYLTFMGDSDAESEVQSHFRKASEHRANFGSEINAVYECAPSCP